MSGVDSGQHKFVHKFCRDPYVVESTLNVPGSDIIGRTVALNTGKGRRCGEARRGRLGEPTAGNGVIENQPEVIVRFLHKENQKSDKLCGSSSSGEPQTLMNPSLLKASKTRGVG